MITHQLTVPQALAGTVDALLLLVQLALLRSVVVSELITLYSVQAFLVSLVCLALGIGTHAYDLIALAMLTLLLKVIALPAYMRALLQRVSTRVELPARINVTLSLLIAAGLMGIAILTASRLPIHAGGFLPNANLATTLAIVFIGFLVAILRPNALAQVIAFLTLDDGLFFGTVTLTPGLPFVIGILLLMDALVAVFVFSVLLRVLVAQHASASTEPFQRLRG